MDAYGLGSWCLLGGVYAIAGASLIAQPRRLGSGVATGIRPGQREGPWIPRP
jgi:hypothetical protein